MVSLHPAKSGGHRNCRSGDKMLLEVEEQDPTCSHFNSSLLFISKGHGLMHMTHHMNNSNPGRTHPNSNWRKI